MTNTKVVEITDPSGAAQARRVATGLASGHGFDVQDVGRIALVVTELSTNLGLHAGMGKIALTVGRRASGPFFQALALDSGPGFDLDACLRDGHSTSGTAGGGLGAIRRMSDAFDAYTPRRQKGSVLFAEIRERHAAPPAPVPLLLAGLSVPKEGEEECGDAWASEMCPPLALVLLADGIGHGPEAAMAARQALRTFRESNEREPAAIVEQIHLALRPTRGATVGVAVVDTAARRVQYSGIGNIAASVAGADPARHLVSHNGTAGREARRIQQFEYPWPDDGLLVMASDGLSVRWNLDDYPGLRSRHPAVVAGVLYRDFARRRDDATVVVGREMVPGSSGRQG